MPKAFRRRTPRVITDCEQIEDLEERARFVKVRLRAWQRKATALLMLLPPENREQVLKDISTIALGIRPIDMTLETFTKKAKFLKTERTPTYSMVARPDISVDDVRRLKDKGRTIREIAKELKCSNWTIWNRLQKINNGE